MLKKNLVLGSVATLALAVAMSPAFAQSPPQYPDFSLPWEQAETTQLNAQQASEPGIIASTGQSTTGVVASNAKDQDVVAYNQALAAQQAAQAQISSEQSAYQSQLKDYNAKKQAFDDKKQAFSQSWSDYQSKLNAYNQQMSGWNSASAAMVAPSAAIVSGPAAVVSPPSTVVSQQIVTRPIVRERVAEETFTRPVITEQTVTRPVVTQETVMRPHTVWVPESRQVVRNETVTQPVVTQQTYTRPVVRQEVVQQPVVRERIVREQIIERPVIGESVVAANTAPVTDQWVAIYPHHERLVVVETVNNPDSSLHGASVMDRNGTMVGTFQHMMTGAGGIPEAVITLSDNRTVAVSDRHLRFDPAAKMIVADLSFRQMDEMPSIG